MPSTMHKFTFRGALGKDLAARLDLPSGPIRAYALFAHCFTCGKDTTAASRIAGGLAAHGIAVLRFDLTGLGGSDGEFANTDFTSNVGDLVAAARHLAETREAPSILIGHSLGGAAVLAAAAEIPTAKAVCTIAAPADPAHVENAFRDDIDRIERDGEADVHLAGRPFRITKQFLDDIRERELLDTLGHLRKALLILHSPVDETVGIDNATAIFKAARHPKSFVSLDHADHLLSDRADAAYSADVISAWATRYIDAMPMPDDAIPAPADAVVVQETGTGTYANNVLVHGAHRMIADEPASVGGTDTGPSPYEFLLAALGSCKSMTMRMYAARKGWALERARVTLRHRKIHAEDCAECETKEGMIDEIDVVIDLAGDLSDEQRRKIFEIANKCPVHRTLEGEVEVRSELEA